MKDNEIFRRGVLKLSQLSSLELLRKYLLFRVTCPLVSIIDRIPKKRTWIAGLAKLGLLNAFLDQFTGGQGIDSAIGKVKQLMGPQNRVILDFASESARGQRDPFRHFRENASKIPKNSAISLKMSTILDVLDLDDADKSVFVGEFSRFCESMKRVGVRVMVDAEESEYQDAIDDIVMRAMPSINTNGVFLFNTYQMYRIDTRDKLQSHLEMSRSGDYGLGIKLVRGAYTEHERGREFSLLHATKERVDEDYDRTMLELMKQAAGGKNLSAMIATHNETSVMMACDALSRIPGRSPDNIAFAQLFGMGSAIGDYVVSKGRLNYKYIPYGEIDGLVPYMLRRARENGALSEMAANEAGMYLAALLNKRG